MFVALFPFVAADWKYSNVLIFSFIYFRPGIWCIVLRSDSYLNLFFRSNFTIIFTTKQGEGSQMGFFYSVTFVFVLNRRLIQVYCPRCIMNSSYTFHIFMWICKPARVLGHLSPSIKNKIVRSRKDRISWFYLFNSYQILTFLSTLNKFPINIFIRDIIYFDTN